MSLCCSYCTPQNMPHSGPVLCKACTMQPCISLQHPLHLFNLVNQVISNVKINVSTWEKTEVGELGCCYLFKPLHREDCANVWRHLVDILIPFVEPLNVFTETYDLWVKVIHTEMEFDYKIPTITWRSFALLCNSHNVTFTFKQISYFLGPRFWNYQIPPHVQAYTSEHKGPDEHRNKESLDFHTNCSTSVSLLLLPRSHAVCEWPLLHPSL